MMLSLPKLLSALLALTVSVQAAEPDGAALSAGDLAARLSAKQQDGNAYIRLKMENTGAAKSVLQLQIKSRATAAGTDLVYQVLWPKERKGEAVLLRKPSDRPATGAIFTPPDTVRTLPADKTDDPLFGSALAYEDVVENFFAWDKQTIAGTETVEKVNCQILESKPGKNNRTSYTSVRSWIDLKRMVPLRVEKYAGSGKLVRRIDTTRVMNDDRGHPLPANLTVHGPGGAVTEMDGSKIKHGVALTDADFSPNGIKQLTIPHDAPE